MDPIPGDSRMKILHTADWHLGVTTNRISRAADHDHFLHWLFDLLVQEEVDALVVAGDIFDNPQPSGGAQEQYYGFLARCALQKGLQLVIVGGNHDAPSRLHAPARLLRQLKIHVAGGMNPESMDADLHLVPLRNRTGQIGAVVLAVPFVPEWRLGARLLTQDGEKALETQVSDRLEKIYSDLADLAEATYPGVPLVATGHLTVRSSDSDRKEDVEIHRVGSIDAVSPSIFDPRIRYVALGHIHQSYPVDAERRAWYSGSPIPIGVRDGAAQRRVLLVELDPETGAVTVEPRPVPGSRPLIQMEGSLEEVQDQIRGLVIEGPLPPLLYIEVKGEELPRSFDEAFNEALESHPPGSRPGVPELRFTRTGTGDTPGSTVGNGPDVRDEQGNLDPHKVFEALINVGGGSEEAEVRAAEVRVAFHRLLSMSDEEVQEEVEALERRTP